MESKLLMARTPARAARMRSSRGPIVSALSLWRARRPRIERQRMGVTIHFEGQLIDESAYRSLIDVAGRFAAEQEWLTEPIEISHTTLLRVRDEKDWDYAGPVKGISVYPHEDCE